ncbi:hypothetical protein L1887_30046 [Cichorium endivia]|nr:hypothetical protein L1887_30046 [Cichorium endivia]
MMTSVYREVHCWELRGEACFFGAPSFVYFHFVYFNRVMLLTSGCFTLDLCLQFPVDCLSCSCIFLLLYILPKPQIVVYYIMNAGGCNYYLIMLAYLVGSSRNYLLGLLKV